MSKNFLSRIHERRSIYGLTNTSTISDEKLLNLIEMLTEDVPSAFNCQSARLVVLLQEEHQKFWNIAMEALRRIVPPAAFAPTEEKINSFAAAYGTILYFDDENITNSFAEQYPTYAANFKPWADQASGMLQFAIWTALEAEGLGANLQHYNPLVDDEVKATFNLPSHYRLIAQMPFGCRTAEAAEKVVQPASERIRVFK